jgi:hypothetical protein
MTVEDQLRELGRQYVEPLDVETIAQRAAQRHRRTVVGRRLALVAAVAVFAGGFAVYAGAGGDSTGERGTATQPTQGPACLSQAPAPGGDSDTAHDVVWRLLDAEYYLDELGEECLAPGVELPDTVRDMPVMTGPEASVGEGTDRVYRNHVYTLSNTDPSGAADTTRVSVRIGGHYFEITVHTGERPMVTQIEEFEPPIEHEAAAAALDRYVEAMVGGQYAEAARLLAAGGGAFETRPDLAPLGITGTSTDALAGALAAYCGPGCPNPGTVGLIGLDPQVGYLGTAAYPGGPRTFVAWARDGETYVRGLPAPPTG